MEETELLALAKCPIFTEFYYIFSHMDRRSRSSMDEIIFKHVSASIIKLSAQQKVGKETDLIVLVCITVDVGRTVHLF